MKKSALSAPFTILASIDSEVFGFGTADRFPRLREELEDLAGGPIAGHWVYQLVKNDEVVYTGRTNRLVMRLFQHITRSGFHGLILTHCESFEESVELEARTIHEVKPRYNSHCPICKSFRNGNSHHIGLVYADKLYRAERRRARRAEPEEA